MTDKSHRGIDARVNSCMHVLMGYAAKVKPQVVVMESVRPAFTNGRSLMQALRWQLEYYSGLRYDLHHVFQDAIELGGAARRKRYFLVASRVPFGVSYPRLTRTPTLNEVLYDLTGLKQTWHRQPYRRPANWWTGSARAEGGPDGAIGIDNLGVRRVLEVLAECRRDGGWPPGWYLGKVLKNYHDRYGTVPESFRYRLDKLIRDDWHMGYIQTTRWDGERSARVITGGALGLVIHPTEDRLITHREAARIMGFPDDWRIEPLRHVRGMPATWGKGITTQPGRWIGTQVRLALDGRPSESGELIGDREWFHDTPRHLRIKSATLATRQSEKDAATRREIG